MSFRIAVVEWAQHRDALARVICEELAQQGHHPVRFSYDAPIPEDVEVVFTFAPYGPFLPIARNISCLPPAQRPILVHWNTEGAPDLRMPWPLVRGLGAVRSWIDRLAEANASKANVNRLITRLATSVQSRAIRFRYIGDYYYAYRQGWLHVFCDTSAVYARLHDKNGLPTVVVPWGTTPSWYADLGLERDISVLWMGLRGTRRRDKIINQVRQELEANGVDVYVADNQEHPFIFNQERTHFLNRAKITLNLTRTWYDDNFSRFTLAAPNRSLLVSEPLLPHCPPCQAGVHYVSAPVSELAKTIIYYLKHDDERLKIVENAYELAMTVLTLENSLKTVMQAVELARKRVSFQQPPLVKRTPLTQQSG